MNKRPNNKFDSKTRKSYWLFLRWPIYIIAALIILFFASSPLRLMLSNSYVNQGDNLLEQKKYLSAEVQYYKALILKKNDKAKDRIELSHKAQRNVLELESFYQEKNNQSQLDLYSQVKDVPANAKDAVELAQELIKKGEYQLAIVAADTGVQMDPGYDIARRYLSIAYEETANTIELSPENQEYYRSQK